MMTMWPQVLMGLMLIGVVIGGFVRHGKPGDAKPINCIHVLWCIFMFAAILGAGGFWNPR